MSLEALRSAATSGQEIELKALDGSVTPSIKDAVSVQLGGKLYPLDDVTNFYNEDQPQTLRAVVFAWLHDKLLIVDYRSECIDNEVSDFKFLVKTELSSWLSGKSDTCEFIRQPDSNKLEVISKESKDSVAISGTSEDSDSSKKRKFVHERESVDHNAVLRGSKNINFGYLILDAKKLIQQLKKGKYGSLDKDNSKTGVARGSGKSKQPIIIVSPATTALLSLANIKEFFENGKFVDPNQLKRPENGIVTIKHHMDRVSPVAHEIMVVDNVELFTKPEYWDRVIAVFTTGQAWQFSKYKYAKPEHLFQKYSGFYVGYQGDVTPKQIKDWNVNEIKVDRGDKRFRDKMIVRDFWALLEKILVQKGYGA